MDDIVPGLLDEMKKDFQSQYDGSTKVKELKEKLNSGNATYAEANEYASEVGEITKKIYEKHLTSENLPDGKCYYNIAERVTSSTLHDQYELVADYTEQIQTDLNKKAGIGLKAQRADEDTEGYRSLANYMSSAENYDDIAKSTAQSAERFARSTVDNSVKKNTEFQGKAGLSPKIVRDGGSGCCAWCSGLSGTYDYPKVPKDVYSRHNNCTCTVEYDPGSGKRQDVHTKQWRETDSETLQRRQTVGLDKGDESAKIQYRKNLSEGVYSAKGNVEYPFSHETTVKPAVLEAFNQELEKAKAKFGDISTIKNIFVLNTNSNDEGIYYNNGGEIGLRHAGKEDGLQTMAKIAREKFNKGKWSTSHPHHVMRHEIGHAIQYEHELNDPKWENKKARIYKIYKDSLNEENNRKAPSEYSKDTPNEFISECIAASYSKKQSSTVKKVISIILEE